jgi:methylmalonyl-CoA/ethylmalonyl-CoA epimerase
VTRLDHVALATHDAGAALSVLVSQWGGTILFGGQAVGYRPMQIRLGDAEEGMTVELLEPWEAERNDFLARFLARNGEGPHHLTFKVDSLAEMLDRVTEAGLTPVGVDLSDPTWKEAFLHPREAHGTVVQLAETTYDDVSFAELFAHVRAHGPDGNPRWWPEPAPSTDTAVRVALRRVVLATPDIGATLTFYERLLDGEVVDTGEGWAEVAWPGGGRLRLEAGRGAGGVTRLEADADGSGHEVIVAGARFVVAPRR